MVGAATPALGDADRQDPAPTAIGLNLAKDLPKIVLPGKGTLPELDRYEQIDAEKIASSADTNYTNLFVGLRGQGVWQDAIKQVQDTYPQQFVNAGRDVPQPRAWLTLTGDAPKGLAAIVARLPFDVEVRYGAPQNAAQLRKIASAALNAVAESGIKNTGYQVDDESGAITITYKPTSSTNSRAALTQLATDAARQVAGGSVPVSFQVVPDPSYAVENYYAGGHHSGRAYIPTYSNAHRASM